MKSVPAGAGLVGALLASTSALAQTAPAASPPPSPAPGTPPAEGRSTTVQGVVVKAEGATPMKSSIDRRSYSVEGDLQATTGSIADALKRVPSVEVDIDGNVKLRGDSSVTILIDGKPTALMSGPGRADALQMLPADQIERVEILTNPGAQYSPEGTGGVINLVTKKARKTGTGVSGSVRLNLGTQSRANGGFNWAYASEKLTLSANLGIWRMANAFESTSDLTLVGPGGDIRTRTETEARSRGQGANLRLAGDSQITPRDKLSAEFSLFAARPEFRSESVMERFDGAGLSLGVTERSGRTTTEPSAVSGSLSWRRDFAGDDHNLTLELETSRWEADNRSAYLVSELSPPGPDELQESGTLSINENTGLKGDYSRPVGEARLKAGFEARQDTADIDSRFFVGPGPGLTVFDPIRSHRLVFDETVYSGYVTWEQPFGDFTVLAGLRFESATNDLEVPTSGQRASHDYDRVYPSLHLDYRLSETTRIKASYTLRIQRPGASDLDPWRVYIDDFNYREGNPNLEPAETGSWEASWEYRKGPTYYLATGFWRETVNSVTTVQTDLGGGVLLTSRANLGESRSGGLEFAANSKLGKTLTLNLTGTAMWNEIDASSLGFTGQRSGYSLSGRASLDWQATPDDLLQLNAVANGRILTPQGYIEPFHTVNLGYRRKLNERWFLTVTATDVFDTQKFSTVTDSPTIYGSMVHKSASRGLFVGVRYRFGAFKPGRDPGFDYSGPGGSGGPPN